MTGNLPSPPPSKVVRALHFLAETVSRHRRFFFYSQILLFVFCIFYTKKFLKMDSSRNSLVGSNQRYHQIFLSFKKEFPAEDDLVVVVESAEPEKSRQFVERLGARLQKEPELFKDVFFKADLQILGRKSLFFLSEDDLKNLMTSLTEYEPFIVKFGRATNLVSLFLQVNTLFRTAAQEATPQNNALVKAFPALRRIIERGTDALIMPGAAPSPGISGLLGASPSDEQKMYLTFNEGKMWLLTTRSREEKVKEKTVERLRQLILQVQQEVPGLNAGLTGEPVLEYDEMAQSTKDSALATVISLVLCALIFITAYKETGRPLKATAALIIGMAYTMAYTTLFVGHLNILTITFAPILIGLAIDLGVHLISRYEEEVRHGKTERDALERAMVNTGQGIFTGAFTTAGAFLAMGLTDFQGIQEMGIICGGGMIVCLIPMMTFLPVLLLRGRQNILDHRFVERAERRARIEMFWLERPMWIIVLTGGLTVLALTQMRKVDFDYNLLNLQSAGLPAVIVEKKLIQGASKSVLYGAVIATNLDQARRLERQLTNLSTVASVDSMVSMLSDPGTTKIPWIQKIQQKVASLNFGRPDPAPVDLNELSQTLWSLQGYLGLALEEVRRLKDPVEGELNLLREAIIHFRYQMLNLAQDPGNQTVQRLSTFQQAFFEDLRRTFSALRNQRVSEGMQPGDLPPFLRNRFVGVSGNTFLIQIYPREDIWQRPHQAAFIREVRKVAPEVTGSPVQFYEYITLLKTSYQIAAWYSLAAIVVLVLIHFRSVSCLLLALMPVGIGIIWLVGLMGWFNISFNPANIMTLPLVIGIGVTNGIHILNRFAEEQNPNILAKSTGKAVLVSGLTTIAGFGSLMVAQHRGIASLGYVMAIGVSTCMIVGLTSLPALLTLMSRRGWRIKETQRR